MSDSNVDCFLFIGLFSWLSKTEHMGGSLSEVANYFLTCFSMVFVCSYNEGNKSQQEEYCKERTKSFGWSR